MADAWMDLMLFPHESAGNTCCDDEVWAATQSKPGAHQLRLGVLAFAGRQGWLMSESIELPKWHGHLLYLRSCSAA